jgi:hypothetical protein
MKKQYNFPLLKVSESIFDDILLVSKVEDVLDIFDVDVNEEL